MVERYGLVPDSGGAGRFRGGLAVERVWRCIAPDTAVHVRSDRQVHRPYGLAGGGEGAASSTLIFRADGTLERMPPMFGTVLQPGDVMHHRMAGGGGHGNPLERDPQAVGARRASTTRCRSRPRASCTGSSSTTRVASTSRRPRSCAGASSGERSPAPPHPPGDTPGTDTSASAPRETHLPPRCDRAYSRSRDMSVPTWRRFVHRRTACGRDGRRAVSVGSALLASGGGDRVSLILGLEPAWPSAHALGPALTVQGAPGDNLALHHAVAEARPGELIVLAVGGETATAHCGEIVALAARERGVAGIVVDGAIRDRAQLEALGAPGLPPRNLASRPGQGGPGALRVPVAIGGTTVQPGDLVCADADGVASSAAEPTRCSPPAGRSRSASAGSSPRSSRGESTVAIFGLKELA